VASSFCSPTEAAALLDALPAADRALWAVAFYAGLRRGELVALRWEDVDLATGVIRVQRGWDAVEGEIAPKSRQGRRAVPVPVVLRDYLVEHRMSAAGDGRVFASDRQVRAQAERAAYSWGWKKEGGEWQPSGTPHPALPRVTLHDCRHTYASLMIAAGVNAKALSTFMGHANIAITIDLYGHLMPGSEAEAAELLGAYLARAAEPTSPETSPEPVQTAA
jgi:integrase